MLMLELLVNGFISAVIALRQVGVGQARLVSWLVGRPVRCSSSSCHRPMRLAWPGVLARL